MMNLVPNLPGPYGLHLDSLRLKTDAELAALVEDGLMNDVCEKDDLPTLRYLVEERHLPIDRPCRGDVPLIMAAEEGSQEMVDFLLAHGANVNQNCEGYTPIAFAALSYRPRMVLHLLDRGANPSSTFYTRDDVLFCMLTYPDVLKRLLEAGTNPDYAGISHHSPLDTCCWLDEDDWGEEEPGIRVDKDLTEVMQILLDGGACPYLTNAYQDTSGLPDTPAGRKLKGVIERARRDATPAIDLYLDLRQDRCDSQTFTARLRELDDVCAPCPWKNGMDFLQWAVHFGSEEALDYLLSRGCRWTADADYLWSACISGSRAMVERMLREGFEPEEYDYMWIAIYGETPMKEELLWLPFELGWKPAPDSDGYTVLHSLAFKKDLPMALEVFIAYVERMGIDPEAEDDDGDTPRSIAARCDFTALLDYLDKRKNP